MKFSKIYGGENISGEIYLDAGKIEQTEPNFIIDGDYAIRKIHDVKSLKEIINECTYENILVSGLHNKVNGHITPQPTTKKHISLSKNFYHRYKVVTHGFLYLEHKTYDKSYTKKEFIKLLFKVAPQLKGVPYLIRCSPSANISHGKVKTKNGFQLFFELNNVKDAQRINTIIYNQFILQGYAHGIIDKCGRVEIKTLIEPNTNSADYQIHTHLKVDPLLKTNYFTTLHNADKMHYSEDVLDTSRVHERQIEKIVNDINSDLEEERKVIRENFIASQTVNQNLMEYSLNDNSVFGDFTLHLHSGEDMTIRDVFNHMPEFADGTLSIFVNDPFSDGVARIDFDKGILFAYSTNRSYKLKHSERLNPKELARHLGQYDGAELFRKAAFLSKEYDYLATEQEELRNYLKDIKNLTIATLKLDINRYLKYLMPIEEEEKMTPSDYGSLTIDELKERVVKVIDVFKNDKYRRRFNIMGSNRYLYNVRVDHKEALKDVIFYTVSPADLLELCGVRTSRQYAQENMRTIMEHLSFDIGLVRDNFLKISKRGYWIVPQDPKKVKGYLLGEPL